MRTARVLSKFHSRAYWPRAASGREKLKIHRTFNHFSLTQYSIKVNLKLYCSNAAGAVISPLLEAETDFAALQKNSNFAHIDKLNLL